MMSIDEALKNTKNGVVPIVLSLLIFRN